MPILRHEQAQYTKIATSMLQTGVLSLSAKGLLCFMLSCADNWKFSIAGLAKVCNTTKYEIEKSLGELEELGYHKKIAQKYEDGRFREWEYWISDMPDFLSPDFDLPKLANSTHIIITNNKTIKKEKKKESLFTKCANIVEEKFTDDDIKKAMLQYLSVRIKVGLTEQQWRSIAEELFVLADTKEQALEVINKAYTGGYRKLYPIDKKKSTGYVDNIQQTEKTDDGKLRDLYREEFSMTPVKDRPKFEDWLKEKQDERH